MRRAVIILAAFACATGYPHPYLHGVVNNYAERLNDMGRSQDEIRATFLEIARELFK